MNPGKHQRQAIVEVYVVDAIAEDPVALKALAVPLPSAVRPISHVDWSRNREHAMGMLICARGGHVDVGHVGRFDGILENFVKVRFQNLDPDDVEGEEDDETAPGEILMEM